MRHTTACYAELHPNIPYQCNRTWSLLFYTIYFSVSHFVLLNLIVFSFWFFFSFSSSLVFSRYFVTLREFGLVNIEYCANRESGRIRVGPRHYSIVEIIWPNKGNTIVVNGNFISLEHFERRIEFINMYISTHNLSGKIRKKQQNTIGCGMNLKKLSFSDWHLWFLSFQPHCLGSAHFIWISHLN